MLRTVVLILVLTAAAGIGLGRLSYDRNRELLAPAPGCLTSVFRIIAVEGDTKRAAVAKDVLREAEAPCAKLAPMYVAFEKMALEYLAERSEAVATLRDWLQRGGFACELNKWGDVVMCECNPSGTFVYYWPCSECTPMFSRPWGPRRIGIWIQDFDKLAAAAKATRTHKTRFDILMNYQAGPDWF